MAGDVYRATDDLIMRLRADGADRWADVLNDAVESGSTGTEILMALRHHVDNLLQSGEASVEAVELSRRLKSDLDDLLAG